MELVLANARAGSRTAEANQPDICAITSDFIGLLLLLSYTITINSEGVINE